MTLHDPSPLNDGSVWLSFAVASATLIGMMGLLAFGLRLAAEKGWTLRPRSKNTRLRLIETLPLDTRNRLVIVSCDRTEHLLVIGGDRPVVVSACPPLPPDAASPDRVDP